VNVLDHIIINVHIPVILSHLEKIFGLLKSEGKGRGRDFIVRESGPINSRRDFSGTMGPTMMML